MCCDGAPELDIPGKFNKLICRHVQEPRLEQGSESPPFDLSRSHVIRDSHCNATRAFFLSHFDASLNLFFLKSSYVRGGEASKHHNSRKSNDTQKQVSSLSSFLGYEFIISESQDNKQVF